MDLIAASSPGVTLISMCKEHCLPAPDHESEPNPLRLCCYGVGTYTGWMYNQKAVAVIQTAPEPFFLNYWMQNTHAPFEVPEMYSALYAFEGNP